MNHTAHRTFCDASMSMTMYMDGFRAPLWAYLFHHQPASAAPPPCLNFLLRSWTLDTPLKFGAAMATVLMLGIGVEALAAARSGGALQSYLRRHRRRHPPRSVTCRLTPRQRKWILQSAVVVGSHVLQALCGYALMLAAMSYSVELLGSALIGLGIGYALCFEVDSPGGWADGEEIDIGGGGDGGDAEDDTNEDDDPEESDLEVGRPAPGGTGDAAKISTRGRDLLRHRRRRGAGPAPAGVPVPQPGADAGGRSSFSRSEEEAKRGQQSQRRRQWRGGCPSSRIRTGKPGGGRRRRLPTVAGGRQDDPAALILESFHSTQKEYAQ